MNTPGNPSGNLGVSVVPGWMVGAIAAWFALAAGLLEAAAVLVQRFVLHWFVRASVDVVWMIPLVNLIVVGVLALALLVLGRFWAQGRSLPVVVGVVSFVAYAGLLLLVTALSKWAVLMLALGLAVQTGRLAGAHHTGFERLIVRSLGWPGAGRTPQRDLAATPTPTVTPEAGVTRRDFLAGATIPLAGLAAGVHAWRSGAERLATASLPPARPGLPNVLVIVLDTVRTASLSLYGYQRPTAPNLTRLAMQGVWFDRAFSTAPWTLPSHASLFTGRYPHELTAGWQTPLDGSHRTLAEAARAEGYRTGAFVANTLYCQSETGLSRGFDHFSDYTISPGEIAIGSSLGRVITNSHHLRRLVGYQGVLAAKSAHDVNAEFIAWLKSGHRTPFFVFLNYFDAHEPYVPPVPFDNLFGATRAVRKISRTRYWGRQGGRLDKREMSREEIQAELDAYEGTIAYLDGQLGALFEDLAALGALDDTLVAIIADHGEQFGEHGLHGHGNSLYLPLLHVPLLFVWPRKLPAAVRVHAPVTLRDVAATLAALVPLSTEFPGASLAPHWRGGGDDTRGGPSPLLAELERSTELQPYSPGSRGNMRTLIEGEYHYVRNGDGTEELFNWVADPSEISNLAASSDTRLIAGFRQKLAAAVRR
jgi:arylsulfatase A-like enzyme